MIETLYAIARAIPLAAYTPLRTGVVSFHRGSLVRKACTAVLKLAARAYRGRLTALLVEIRPLDEPRLVFSAVDSMVMDAIYWFGVRGYEGKVADVWVALCRRAGAVLEVGGNVGLFTVIGARACAGPYTVLEPVPAISAVLRGNLERNGLGHVSVLEAAAIPGMAAVEVTINVPDERRGAPVGAHLIEDVEVRGRSSAGLIHVTGRPFRDLLVGCDLVKIDAEGIEGALIKSARDIILAERPTLLLEVLPSATHLATLIAEFAHATGYKIYIIPEWGSDIIVSVPADAFTAALPARYHSKDIVMSTMPLPL